VVLFHSANVCCWLTGAYYSWEADFSWEASARQLNLWMGVLLLHKSTVISCLVGLPPLRVACSFTVPSPWSNWGLHVVGNSQFAPLATFLYAALFSLTRSIMMDYFSFRMNLVVMRKGARWRWRGPLWHMYLCPLRKR